MTTSEDTTHLELHVDEMAARCKCEECGKSMESFPFKSANLCLKCVMETKFERFGPEVRT